MNTNGSGLAAVLTDEELEDTSGPVAFERGREYAKAGRVRDLAIKGERLTGTVQGAQTYRVALWEETGAIQGSCTCPVAARRDFCKHMVAVGLAWLKSRSGSATSSPPPQGDREAVKRHLASLPKEQLVDLVLEQSAKDAPVEHRLRAQAAARVGRPLDTTELKDLLVRSIRTGGFVRWGQMPEYMRGIDQAVDALEEVLSAGYGTEVIELAELALKKLERAMNHVDDSDGFMGEMLKRVQAIHHRACQRAKPYPERLAKRLFAWEMRSDWEVFIGAARTYADVLGPRGLADYLTLAEKEWAKVPTLAAGSNREPGRFAERFRITHMMESLAEAAGDVDALVEVMSKDLSSGYQFVRIADRLRAAGRLDDAIGWAERGLSAFREKPDNRLVEVLANLYHDKGRHNEALNLIWDRLYAPAPSAAQYAVLKSHATRAEAWSAWKERARTSLREWFDRAKARVSGQPVTPWGPRVDHSELVQMLIEDGEMDVAWVEAQAGGCRSDLWLKLAETRENTAPDDALAVYRRHVTQVLIPADPRAYQEAVRRVRHVGAILRRLGRNPEFVSYVRALQEEYRRRPSLVKLLNEAVVGRAAQ